LLLERRLAWELGLLLILFMVLICLNLLRWLLPRWKLLQARLHIKVPTKRTILSTKPPHLLNLGLHLPTGLDPTSQANHHQLQAGNKH
jgi:hypothetical protein